MEKLMTVKTLVTTTGSIGFSTIFALSQDIEKAMTLLTFLIMMDFVTGLIKSWQIKETSSEGMARGFSRKGVLIIIPFTIAILGNIVGVGMEVFLTWSISVLAFSEAYSILGNIYTIQSGKRIKEYDAVSIIIKKLGKIIDTFLIDKK